MGFLDDYEPVSDRIARFWEKYPEGRIHTTIVERTETDIIIQADIFTDRDDVRPVTTDYAHETIGSSNINRTSWLENCATSAIGRALADLDFQAKKGGKTVRPSREEMTKVEKAKTPQRDFLTEALSLASEGRLEALRELQATAIQSGEKAPVLEQISALGKKLAQEQKLSGQVDSEGVEPTPPF